jgi:hypothetical protein
MTRKLFGTDAAVEEEAEIRVGARLLARFLPLRDQVRRLGHLGVLVQQR